MFRAAPKSSKPSDIAGSLQRFCDIRRDAASRWKHFLLVLRALGDQQEQKRHFFEEHSFEAFHLMHDMLCGLELGAGTSTGATSSSGSGASTSSRNFSPVECTIYTLEQILINLPDLICRRWQYKAIESILKKCLSPHNAAELRRKHAIRLFLLWYQLLGSNGQAGSELDAVFMVLIPHFPIPSGDDTEQLLDRYCNSVGSSPSLPDLLNTTQAHGGQDQYAPLPVRNLPILRKHMDNSQPSADKRMQQFLENFFDAIGREASRVEWRTLKLEHQRKCVRFLVDRIKQLYVPAIFPHLTDSDSEINLYASGSARRNLSPSGGGAMRKSSKTENHFLVMAQFWLTKRIADYCYSHRDLANSLGKKDAKLNQFNASDSKRNETRFPQGYTLMRDVLFGSRENINFALTMLREALLLPTQCTLAFSRSHRVLREWLLQIELPLFMREPCEQDARFVGVAKATETMLSMLSSFYTDSRHLFLDVEMQQTATELNRFSRKLLDTFNEMANPQKVQLADLAAETWAVFVDCLLNMVDSAIPPLPTQTQSSFVLSNSTALFQTALGSLVFVAAVRGVILPDALWNKALDVFSVRTAWCQLIDEWGLVLDSLTNALSLYFYGIDLSDPPLNRVNEHTSKVRAGIAKRRLSGVVGAGEVDGEVNTSESTRRSGHYLSADEQNELNFCQLPRQKSPAASNISSPSDERRSMEHSVCSLSAPRPRKAVFPRVVDDVDQPPTSAPPVMPNNSRSQQSSTKTKSNKQPNGSVPEPNENIDSGRGDAQFFGDSGRSTGDDSRAPIDSASVEDSASLDSSSLPGVNTGRLFSGNELTSLGSDVISGDISPMFDGDDESVNEEGDDECEIEQDDDYDQDKAGTLKMDLTPRDHPSVDSTLTSVDATVYNANWMCVWRRFVCLIGDINAIADPINHAKAVHVIANTVDALIKIRQNQGVSADSLPCTVPKFVPPRLWLAPPLFATLELDDRFVDSKRTAIVALCRMFIAHRLDSTPSLDVLAQFITAVRHCLSGSDILMANAVLSSVSPQIFFELISGADVLYPAAMLTCEMVLKSPNLALNKSKAIQLAAVLCNLKNVDAQIKERAQKALLFSLSQKSVTLDGIRCAINGLSCAAISSHTRPTSDKDTRSFDALLELMASTTDDAIVVLIYENLYPVFEHLPMLAAVERIGILNRLLGAVESLVNRCGLMSDTASLLVFSVLEIAVRCTTDAGTVDSTLPVLLNIVESCERSDEPRLQEFGRSARDLLLQFHGQFPLPQFTVAQVNSIETADEVKKRVLQRTSDEGVSVDQQLVYLTHGVKSRLVWSGSPIEYFNHQLELNLTVRNSYGKRCWALSSAIDGGGGSNVTPTSRGQTSAEFPDVNDWLLKCGEKSKTRLKERQKSGIFGAISEPLTDLFDHIAHTSPECLPHAQFPELPADGFLPNEADIKATVHQMAVKRQAYERRPPIDGRAKLKEYDTPWWRWRMVLADVDMVNWGSSSTVNRIAATDRSHLSRTLKHLDQLVVRDYHKFAVVYVAVDQEDKTSILSNSIGSTAFEDFVGRLGWSVDLRTHVGYAGGLPPDSESPYYANISTEVVYHVCTRLDQDDFTRKIRHIGNDEVHIIWCEHWRDYRRSIIATHFCDVLIVIYPLPHSKLYRISIETVSPLVFGPLFDGAIVDWPNLPTLVRTTAVNASRSCRRAQSHSIPPFRRRGEELSKVIDELSGQNDGFSKTVAHVYAADISVLQGK